MNGSLARKLCAAVSTAAAVCGMSAGGAAAQLTLPSPVEETVQQSPAGPIRDALPNAPAPPAPTPNVPTPNVPTPNVPTPGIPATPSLPGAGAPGGGAGGGSGNSAPSGAGGGSEGARQGTSSSGAGSPGAARRARSRAAARRAARRRAAARARARRAAARRRQADRGAAASRSVDNEGVGSRLRNIVEVVPGWIKAALVVLALLALAFGARMTIERRRAARIASDRERLQRNVGVLQSALLPEAPQRIGTLAASVGYRPAEGLAAGGDFYDLFELADGRVAVMVGDVSGHGQEALMRTASVRHSLGAYLRAGTEPRGALAAAGALLPMGDDGRFTTVVLAVYDPEEGTLTYACAGHPAPIFTGSAAHEPITCSASPPVGVGVPTGLRQTTVSLPPGTAACFFTDGLVEARRGDALLGRERLAELVAELPEEAPAAALIERVGEEADTAGDDQAVCIVRATAGPKRPQPRVEELEVGTAEEDLARAERMLEACGVGEAEAVAARDELVLASPALLRVTFAKTPRVEVRPLGERSDSLLPV